MRFSKNSLQIACVRGRFASLRPRIFKYSLELLKILQDPRFSLHVYLVSDSFMRGLYRKHKGKSKVTNVLSFPYLFTRPYPIFSSKKVSFEGAFFLGSKGFLLGEIYLAPNYISRKKEDPIFLLIHGFLHVLGYTHEGRHDSIKMQRLEKKLLTLLLG